jgi:RHS repeat-associated protein
MYNQWNILVQYGRSSASDADEVEQTYSWGLNSEGELPGGTAAGALLGTDYYSATGTVVAREAVVSDASGNIVGRVPMAANSSSVASSAYTAFGEEYAQVAGGRLASIGWNTSYRDIETGLLYYGYRYYHPSSGRWLSADPIGEKGGTNLYRSVLNSPTHFSDSLGLSPVPVPPSDPYEATPQGYNERRNADIPYPNGYGKASASYAWRKADLDVEQQDCPCTANSKMLAWKGKSPWLEVGYVSSSDSILHERGHNLNATISFRRSQADINNLLKKCVPPNRVFTLESAAANRKTRFDRYANLLDLAMHLGVNFSPMSYIQKHSSLPIGFQACRSLPQ